MHILVAMEGYRGKIESFIRALDTRLYPSVNPIDNKKSMWSPAVRELRIFNITLPDHCKEKLLTDLNFHGKVFNKNISFWKKISNSIFNLMKPLGFKKVTSKTKAVNSNEILPHGVNVICIGEKSDSYSKEGFESV